MEIRSEKKKFKQAMEKKDILREKDMVFFAVLQFISFILFQIIINKSFLLLMVNFYFFSLYLFS